MYLAKKVIVKNDKPGSNKNKKEPNVFEENLAQIITRKRLTVLCFSNSRF